MCIYKKKGWPVLEWNEKELMIPLADVAHRQGHVLGGDDGSSGSFERH